jgi:hypothetical protein
VTGSGFCLSRVGEDSAYVEGEGCTVLSTALLTGRGKGPGQVDGLTSRLIEVARLFMTLGVPSKTRDLTVYALTLRSGSLPSLIRFISSLPCLSEQTP